MTKRPDNSLSHAVGQFFGHIWKGIRADTSRGSREVGRTTEETHSTDARGRSITLRRTTIDEIEIDAKPGDAGDDRDAAR